MRILALVLISILCSTAGAQVHMVPQPPPPPPPSTNAPPQISVTYNTVMVNTGSTIQVAWNTPVSSPAFVIEVNDTGSSPCTLIASISNMGSTGIVQTEWMSGSMATPYNVSPTSGSFNNAAGATHTITLTASDGTLQDVFTFTVQQDPEPNYAPSINLLSSGAAIQNGSTMNVGYGDTLALLALEIELADQNNDSLTVSASISNLGSTGIVLAEFESSGATAPFALYPSMGVFNTITGATHSLSLTVSDGQAQAVFTLAIVQAPAPGQVEFSQAGQPISHNQPAAGTGRDFGNVDVANMPSAAIVLTVSNTGGQDLTLGTPSLTGQGAMDFVLDLASFSGTVTPGNATSFSVYYDAAMIGVDSAWIEIAHSDTAAPSPFRFEISAVAVAANVPMITIQALPQGTQDLAYTQVTLPVSGGQAPYAFVLLAGSLPTGMTLSPAGEVSGTPTAEGTFQISVRVTDSLGATTTQPLGIEIVSVSNNLSGSGNSSGGGCASATHSSSWLVLLALLAPLALRRRRQA